MTTYWAPYAHLPDRVVDSVMITVDAGVITAIGAGVPAVTADVRLDGVLLPGLANAHSHVFHRALRGRTHDGGGTFWTWRQQMYAVAARLDPDRYHALARAVYAEMVLAGMTAVGEFHYLHHDHRGRRYADPNAMSAALVTAAAEAGLRLTLLDACYLSGGLAGSGHLPLDPVQQRFDDGSVAAWAERVAAFAETTSGAAPTTRVASAVHSVRAVPADDLARLAALRPTGPLHVHLSEQPGENDATLAYYGCTPTELLQREGLLGPDTTVVHATHLTAEDIVLLGRSGTGACVCPTTERDLADGIGPARALADAGCPLSLGSDQHAVIDPFEEIRGLELHERLASRERGRFTPAELITAASAAGYTSLGWDGGRLAVGALADLVAVDAGSVRTTGVPPGQIHYAASAADVRDVVVAGEHVVRAGRHRLGDVAGLLRTALADLEDA